MPLPMHGISGITSPYLLCYNNSSSLINGRLPGNWRSCSAGGLICWYINHHIPCRLCNHPVHALFLILGLGPQWRYVCLSFLVVYNNFKFVSRLDMPLKSGWMDTGNVWGIPHGMLTMVVHIFFLLRMSQKYSGS